MNVCRFDNFQFLEFTALSKRAAAQGYNAGRWEAEFALAGVHSLAEMSLSTTFMMSLTFVGKAVVLCLSNDFTIAALMEIPDQYKAISGLDLLGNIPANRHVPQIKMVLPRV